MAKAGFRRVARGIGVPFGANFVSVIERQLVAAQYAANDEALVWSGQRSR